VLGQNRVRLAISLLIGSFARRSRMWSAVAERSDDTAVGVRRWPWAVKNRRITIGNRDPRRSPKHAKILV